MTDRLFDLLFGRLAFAAACIVLAFAVAEALVQAFGFSLFGGQFSAGRLMEFSGTLLLFVVVKLLRDIGKGLSPR